MQIELDSKVFNVYITYKRIKNMYLKVKVDGLYISCNRLVSKSLIKSFILDNEKMIIEADKRLQRKEEKKSDFYYLGNKYNVILLNTVSKIEFVGDNVYVKNKTYLNTFLRNESDRIFNERLKVCYNLFEEDIPFPSLSIGKMTRKWGYCNKAKKHIKLNFDLIHYSINEIDYVIVHELCHLIEFNHSPAFWKLVKKYKPDYKDNKKVLKEE